MGKKENACKECANKNHCIIYKDHGEVHSSERCIELTHKYRGYVWPRVKYE